MPGQAERDFERAIEVGLNGVGGYLSRSADAYACFEAPRLQYVSVAQRPPDTPTLEHWSESSMLNNKVPR